MTKKNLENGCDKIQKISEAIRKETIEPAQEEARRILDEARKQADQLLKESQNESEQLLLAAQKIIEKERSIFRASLEQAAKQGVEALKQEIEQKLFNTALQKSIESAASDPRLIADLITAVLRGIEKDGVHSDLIAYIPSSINPTAVNLLLTADILKRLSDSTVRVGDFNGGAKIRLENKKMTIDFSNQEIEELLSRYIRKDFRTLFFASP